MSITFLFILFILIILFIGVWDRSFNLEVWKDAPDGMCGQVEPCGNLIIWKKPGKVDNSPLHLRAGFLSLAHG